MLRQAVLSMLVNVALINRWSVWLGLTAPTDGDLFLYCNEEEKGDEEEHKGKEARRKRAQCGENGQSVTEIRTHWSITKQKVNGVWLGFNCNSFQLCKMKLQPHRVIFKSIFYNTF